MSGSMAGWSKVIGQYEALQEALEEGLSEFAQLVKTEAKLNAPVQGQKRKERKRNTLSEQAKEARRRGVAEHDYMTSSKSRIPGGRGQPSPYLAGRVEKGKSISPADVSAYRAAGTFAANEGLVAERRWIRARLENGRVSPSHRADAEKPSGTTLFTTKRKLRTRDVVTTKRTGVVIGQAGRKEKATKIRRFTTDVHGNLLGSDVVAKRRQPGVTPGPVNERRGSASAVVSEHSQLGQRLGSRARADIARGKGVRLTGTKVVHGGGLRDSIEVLGPAMEMGRLSATILAKRRYAKYVEFGTRHMAARPFLIPALQNNKRSMASMIAALVRQSGFDARTG